MRTVIALFLVFSAWSAQAWEPVCQFTFNKSYDGVQVGRVTVHKEWKAPGRWRFAVGINGLKVARLCPEGTKPKGYVGVRVESSQGGFLDTGDFVVEGPNPETVWRVFDPVYLADCREGAVVTSRWACE